MLPKPNAPVAHRSALKTRGFSDSYRSNKILVFGLGAKEKTEKQAVEASGAFVLLILHVKNFSGNGYTIFIEANERASE